MVVRAFLLFDFMFAEWLLGNVFPPVLFDVSKRLLRFIRLFYVSFAFVFLTGVSSLSSVLCRLSGLCRPPSVLR